MEANEKRDQSAPEQTDTENKIAEAEQTEMAVWESLLEIRYA